MTRYRLVLTHADGEPVGELHRAYGISLRLVLSGTPTASFTLPLSDPIARQLCDPDAEHLLRIYADTDAGTRIVFHGPVVDTETVYGAGGEVAVNAAGPFWRLTHRFIGKQLDGDGKAIGQDFLPYMYRGHLASALLEQTNDDGDTGIDQGRLRDTASLGATGFPDVKFKNVAEWITELGRGQIGATSDGFDWEVEPITYVNGTIGLFHIGAASLSNCIDARLIGRPLGAKASFEMGVGTRNNLISARQPVTRDGLANVIYHVTADDLPVVISTPSTASISARGLHEAVLTDDILDATFRQELVNTHLNVRQQPRRILDIQPAVEDDSGRVPRLWDDYLVGDQVRLRIVEWGEVIVNADVRIYAVEVQVGSDGTPAHTLTIVPS